MPDDHNDTGRPDSGTPDIGTNIFADVFAALSDAACIFEPVEQNQEGARDWCYVANNAAMQALFKVGDLSGRTLRERAPDRADRWYADFERVIAGGAAETVIRSWGTPRQVFQITLSPLRGKDRPAVLALIRDITSEHADRQSRIEVDTRYKTLFNAIDEGFCVAELQFDDSGTGIDYRFLEVNDAFVEQTGLEEPAGRWIREIQPDIEDYWPVTYGRIAQTGVPERFESESPALGRWFDVFAFPIGDAPPYLVGILFEDIGARKQMELALRHSESRLQSLIEATSDLIFRMNPDWTQMEQIDGKGLLGADNAAVSWIDQHIFEEDRTEVQKVLDTGIRQREPIGLEHRVRMADGTVGWLSTRAVPVFDDDGAITEWFGMATDITGRRKVEEQLQHGAHMLRVASEIGRVGIWDWNVETGEVVWSDEHYRMEGYEVGEVTPSYEIWLERLHPDDRDATLAKIDRARETGEEYVNEYRVAFPNGEVHWHSARGAFLYDEKGKPVRMLGAMIDTTERRRQEEWHKLLVAELQHRVRNLISMVRSVARLSSPSHEDVDEYVDHLIGRLQAMGRTQSTLTRLPGKKVDLGELVREELLVHAANEDACRVEGPDVALSPHAAEIVTLAVHELATNSIKYGALGDKGYIRISWKTDVRDGKNWVDLRWQETSPRSGITSQRKGFGSRLIEERIPYELHGKGQLNVHDTGVLAELSFPLSEGPSILETKSHKIGDV